MPETEKSAYDRARDLAEGALGEYAKGDQAKGDKLAEEAVKLDRAAVEDVIRDLEENADETDAGTA